MQIALGTDNVKGSEGRCGTMGRDHTASSECKYVVNVYRILDILRGASNFARGPFMLGPPTFLAGFFVLAILATCPTAPVTVMPVLRDSGIERTLRTASDIPAHATSYAISPPSVESRMGSQSAELLDPIPCYGRRHRLFSRSIPLTEVMNDVNDDEHISKRQQRKGPFAGDINAETAGHFSTHSIPKLFGLNNAPHRMEEIWHPRHAIVNVHGV